MINKKNRCWHCGNPLKKMEGYNFCDEDCEMAYEKEEKSPCLECGTILFTASRKDKKFCDDVCRTDYHNKIKESDLKEIKKIDDALKKNRKITQKLLGKESELIIDKKKMEDAGYNFTYSTHTVISKYKQNVFTFCYNYGYRFLENEKCKIVRAFPERTAAE